MSRAGDFKARVREASVRGEARDTAAAGEIEALLGEVLREEEGTDRHSLGFLAVALERTGDVATAQRLQALIGEAPEWSLYWLKRAISRLTGHSAPPPGADWLSAREAHLDELRQTWAALDLASVPTPSVSWSGASGTGGAAAADEAVTRVDAVVSDGRGVFKLAPDDTPITAAWPEWEYSWCHAGERLYRVGSICGTCEVFLARAGWSPRDAVELAQSVRAAVGDVHTLDQGLLDAVEPILAALASSRYQLRLVDLPLDAVTWMDTWFTEDAIEDVTDSAEVAHFRDNPVNQERLYHPPHAGRPHPLVIAPTQPDLDPATVAAYAEAIADGARPAAVVAAHLSERHNWDTEEPRSSLTGFILDGHHKLAAYAEQRVPARIVLIVDRTPPLGTPSDPLAELDRLMAAAAGGDVVAQAPDAA